MSNPLMRWRHHRLTLSWFVFAAVASSVLVAVAVPSAARAADVLLHPWVQGWKMHSFNQYPFQYLDVDVAKQKAAMK